MLLMSSIVQGFNQQPHLSSVAVQKLIMDDDGYLIDVDSGYFELFQGEGPLGAGTGDYTTYGGVVAAVGGRISDIGPADVVGTHELWCSVYAIYWNSGNVVAGSEIGSNQVSARFTGMCLRIRARACLQ